MPKSRKNRCDRRIALRSDPIQNRAARRVAAERVRVLAEDVRIFVPPADGVGSRVTVRGADTGGAMAVVEQILQPKRLIPPHTHANDVWVYVLSGETGVLVGDAVATGRSGSWLLKPREVVHAMWNPGPEPARIVEVLTPAGSEGFFDEVGGLAESDDAGFAVLCARYGIRFLPDSAWTAELRARYGLV